ncbi:MAG TPA: DNA translocase FtsK [Pseudogracilibacillus sp.]|nr:DNA translocase FtsK [Pseudogracilibacillus sp.]
MWENFKKRVTDFIYEEIDEEEEEQFNHRAERKQVQHRTNRRKPVHARMTYEYPKHSSGNFRFPLIPDEREESEELSTRRRRERKAYEAQRGRSTDSTKPAFVRRKERRRRQYNRLQSVYPRSLCEQKRLVKELEEIPAFERRRNKREKMPEQKEIEAFTHKSPLEFKEEERRRLHYSKPDELDEVFRRKDRKVEDDESVSKAQCEEEAVETFHETNEPFNETSTNSTTSMEVGYVSRLKNSEERADVTSIPKYENSEESYSISRENEVQNLSTEESPSMEKNALNLKNIASDKHKALDNPFIQQKDKTHPNEEKYPSIPTHLLDDAKEATEDLRPWLREQKRLLQQTLDHYRIDAEIVKVTPGPTVTRIEIQPALGVKVSRIRNLADDIKLHLAARDIRIEAPIPGKHTVGIEIPNEAPQLVSFQTMIESEAFQRATSPLSVALGLTIEGEPYVTDIHKMPHGLIAGATGSGKSVCINTMILSILYKAHYNEVKLMLIDPKMVELTQYNGIPHLLTPVITDAKAATVALKWAVDEMERRYELFVEAQVREIKRYNQKATKDPLPYIVIIIDELADLMLVSPQEVEDYISRIAQKARAAGIHLILATQRPSVDVITGLIKANVPTRIAFSVSSQVDSRTILDANGAEKLLGKGDMLFVENGTSKQLRLQGPFVSDDEIDRVVHHLRQIAEPEYFFEHETLFLELEQEEEDELFEEVVSFVIDEGRASTSLLQRRFRIGYNRAARLIDSLYECGIVSAQKGSKPRDVLMTKAQWEQHR